MLRKILALMLLLIFVSSDSALGLGWRHRRCCRRVSHCCCPCPVPENYGPHYCLQDIYMDFPSGPDLYNCILYEGGCGYPPSPYEDLFYGTHQYALPQSCNHPSRKCNTDQRVRRAVPTGHGQVFTSSEQARVWMNENHPGGNPKKPCKYYLVKVGSKTYHVVVIKAHAPNSDTGTKKRYFGVQTEALNGETPDKTFTGIQRDKAIFFEHNVGSEKRITAVWLK